MTRPATLSVALATFNEEANIVACLKAVKKLATQIIVVDGSSTDNTRRLARKHGARVITTTNKPIFHINKNLAIKKCTHDWILQLDADEIVTPALAQEIRRVLEGEHLGYLDWRATTPYPANQPPPVAYWLKRRNFFLGRPLKKSGQYPDPVIRLFKKGHARLPAKDVHEQMTVTGPLAYLLADLDHHASPTFSRYLTRENRYSSLQAQLLLDAGLRLNFFTGLKYFFLLPPLTFFLIFFRHKGFQDGFPGFIFALFSALHFPLSFIKLWDLSRRRSRLDLDKDWS